MNIDVNSKDIYTSRQDVEDMGIRKEQWFQHADSSYTMPFACYNIWDKKKVLGIFEISKFHDGYAWNISSCVSGDGDNITKLKVMTIIFCSCDCLL